VTEAVESGRYGSFLDVCNVPRFTAEQPVNNVTGCKLQYVIIDIIQKTN